jgi:glc operon protein GlcG
MLRLPGGVPFEGGIPLLMNGKIVGAIGVSGDSSDHDGICAQAGAATLK